MRTQPITQEYLINRLFIIIERLDDPDYRITRLDYVILNVSLLRIRYNKHTLTLDNFHALVQCYRTAELKLGGFLRHQIKLFKDYDKCNY